MVQKSPEAFRTISEVSELLDVPQHVLRFWESKFVQVKPLKRAGGRRYYRPADVALLRGIRELLNGDGYTIKGVQKVLRAQGVRGVIAAGLTGSQPLEDVSDDEDEASLPAPLPGPVRIAGASLDDAEELDGAADEDGAAADEEDTAHLLDHQRERLETALAELLALKALLLAGDGPELDGQVQPADRKIDAAE